MFFFFFLFVAFLVLFLLVFSVSLFFVSCNARQCVESCFDYLSVLRIGAFACVLAFLSVSLFVRLFVRLHVCLYGCVLVFVCLWCWCVGVCCVIWRSLNASTDR